MPKCEVSPGIRLYYEDFGDGETVVFIGGGHATHKLWESQVAALAGEFRTITLDWRGTGASDKPQGGYAIETVAADVGTLLDNLCIASAVLVGHGLGAHVAILTTEARPHAIKGLFLTAAAPWMSGERDGQVGGLPEDFLHFVTSHQGASVPYAQTCFELGDKWLFHKPQSPGVNQWILEQALNGHNMYWIPMRAACAISITGTACRVFHVPPSLGRGDMIASSVTKARSISPTRCRMRNSRPSSIVRTCPMSKRSASSTRRCWSSCA